jgi:hypothetical protein
MSRLAIAFVLALSATASYAQDTKSGQSQTPAATKTNGTQPFLFDGRMKDDGIRQRAPAGDRYLSGGAIVMPPKTSQPAQKP